MIRNFVLFLLCQYFCLFVFKSFIEGGLLYIVLITSIYQIAESYLCVSFVNFSDDKVGLVGFILLPIRLFLYYLPYPLKTKSLDDR